MERKQETLTEKFANSIIVEANELEETIKLEVKPKPIIKDDESFSNLATRVIDEVIANKSHVDVAKQVLRQAGIDSRNNVTIPEVPNGHLRHVGRRARKIARKQSDSSELRVRRVKRNAWPASILRIRGAPNDTRERPPLGMEDEVRRSARDASTSAESQKESDAYLESNPQIVKKV